jgi:hypothetical protein
MLADLIYFFCQQFKELVTCKMSLLKMLTAYTYTMVEYRHEGDMKGRITSAKQRGYNIRFILIFHSSIFFLLRPYGFKLNKNILIKHLLNLQTLKFHWNKLAARCLAISCFAADSQTACCSRLSELLRAKQFPHRRAYLVT